MPLTICSASRCNKKAMNDHFYLHVPTKLRARQVTVTRTATAAGKADPGAAALARRAVSFLRRGHSAFDGPMLASAITVRVPIVRVVPSRIQPRVGTKRENLAC